MASRRRPVVRSAGGSGGGGMNGAVSSATSTGRLSHLPMSRPSPTNKHKRGQRPVLPGWIHRTTRRWRRSRIALVLCTLVLLLLVATVVRYGGSRTTSSRSYGNHHPELLLTVAGNATDSCRYDGHCPVRNICVAHEQVGSPPWWRKWWPTVLSVRQDQLIQHPPQRLGPGRCEPIPTTSSMSRTYDSSNTSASCIQACQTELTQDELYYHGHEPPVWMESFETHAPNEPPGCALVYRPGRQAAKPESDAKGREQWWRDRFRHVVRVDPMADDTRWMAYCHSPCRSNADCWTATAETATAKRSLIPPFACQDGVCQRQDDYWQYEDQINQAVTMDASSRVVVVTAATAGFVVPGLVNLLCSLLYWAPETRVVVYNLGGMSPRVQSLLTSIFPNVLALEWPKGIPASLPRHVHKAKVYAWKPLIVNETIHKFNNSILFWMDAGSTVTGPLTPLIDIVQRTGLFLVQGQDEDMRPLSHDATFDWFHVRKKDMELGPHFAGNTQAFLVPSRYIQSIVIPNAECAMDPTCINPKGAYLHNHRFDQTTTSILAYGNNVRAPHYTEYLAADEHQLNENLLQPSFKFLWTSRQKNEFYLKHFGKEHPSLLDELLREVEYGGASVSVHIHARSPLVDTGHGQTSRLGKPLNVTV